MTTERFTYKIIVSGEGVEEYKYKTKVQIRGYKRKKRKKKIKDDIKKEVIENSEKTRFSINRTRTGMRRILQCNPNLDKFLTLTSKITDITKANKCLNLFTQKIKKPYPDFEYFSVPEFQNDIDFFGKVKPDGGAVHHHVLCNLPYVDQKEIAEIWGQGFIKIKRIEKGKNMMSYLSKYLEKEMRDKRMFRKRKYSCSQNLKRPVELIGEQAEEFMTTNNNSLKFKKASEFENQYSGEVDHNDFEFKK
ncbi:MAG: hypothetical protein PHW24_04595 [Candidatus Moranbacteria bacterium]|nr:hypothetical protein [Candidatus Moranbacteria bacterium]